MSDGCRHAGTFWPVSQSSNSLIVPWHFLISRFSWSRNSLVSAAWPLTLLCTLHGFRTYDTKLRSFEFKLQVGLDQVKHCNVACTKTSETTQRQDYPYNTSTPITNFGNASPLIDYSKNPLPSIPEIESAYNNRARKQPTSAGYQVTMRSSHVPCSTMDIGRMLNFCGGRKAQQQGEQLWKFQINEHDICLAG